MHQPDCPYAQAGPARLQLADALDSGTYAQIPQPQRLDGVLRTISNEYSITGVATDILAPSVWVRTPTHWASHPLDVLIDALPMSPATYSLTTVVKMVDFSYKTTVN